MRVTSRGNTLVHELQEAGTPLDATKYDHPVTMLYVDGDHLTLVHYCDAGNRPRMTGKMSPDGKTVEFEFKDISGSTEYAHAPFGVHHHRRQPSHRGLDVHDEGQADPRALRSAPDELRYVVSLVRSGKGSLENLMDREWNDSQPIYRQLRDRVVAMILDGVLKEGDPLPSVRNVAAEYRVNPLTVLKGYQQLVDEGLVESQTGPRHVRQCRAHAVCC